MNHLDITNMPNLPFDVQESLNQLRINLGFSGAEIKTIMITSSTPNEGKSFVAINLWKMMANVGSRVLLIDTDLRNSDMRTKYRFQNENGILGIEHYLSGKIELFDTIYETNYQNGYIIPVSTNIVDPTTLLESNRFKVMLEQCKTRFDYIIVDTPPLGSVADALNIAKHCDGTLLVIRSGEVPRKVVNDSVSLLRRTEVPLLGIVLNRVDTSKRGSNYGYYYRYGYYSNYGYGNGKSDKKKPK